MPAENGSANFERDAKDNFPHDGRWKAPARGHVDVRSICHYIENPVQMDFDARVKKKYPKNLMEHGEFYAASRSGKRRIGA